MTSPVYRVKVLTEDEDGSRDVLGVKLFPADSPEDARELARDEFWDERMTGHYLCIFNTEEVENPCWYCLENETFGECGECGISICEECLGDCCDGEEGDGEEEDNEAITSSQEIGNIIQGLEGKDSKPPTSAALMVAIAFLTKVKDKSIMDENDLAHMVADCQFQDGSVMLSWQGVEGEGTVEADVGAYKSLGEALAAHPVALPVCPDCCPWLAENERDTQHEDGCSFLEIGCETALNR